MTEASVLADFEAALDRNPECREEFGELAEYYAADGALPFPFSEDEDPRHNVLGPIGWWWNIIYIDLFNRSKLLMVLLGWELFLVPIFFGLAVLRAILETPLSLLRSGSAEIGDKIFVRSPAELHPLLATMPGGGGMSELMPEGLRFRGDTTHYFRWDDMEGFEVQSGRILIDMTPTGGGGYRVEVHPGEDVSAWEEVLFEQGLIRQDRS